MVISSPPSTESGPSEAPSTRPSWRVAAATVAATLAVGVGLAAAFHGAMGSAVPPSPPPGAADDAGSVETVADGGPPIDDVAEPAQGVEESRQDEAEPADADDAAQAAEEGPSTVDPAWLDRVAESTGIPRRALEGYASAQVKISEEDPQCQVSWPTLAGIGWVESQHGTYAGGEIGPDGTTTVDVIGVPLDGRPGLARLPDSNDGELDGDTDWDRALGPMQFIPTTWNHWGSDGNGDGTVDPHNVDDAAYTAARYLCGEARDLTDQDDWWEAVLSYNRSEEYGEDVLSTANEYAAAANE